MEKRGGICEAQPAVALLMVGGGIAWLAIREAMPSGAVAGGWAGLTRLGDDRQEERGLMVIAEVPQFGLLSWS